MKLCVVADETLFWPADDSNPSWPCLENINVMFHMSTPLGSWYFQGLPGVGANEGFDVTFDSYPPVATTDEDYEDDDEAANLSWADQQVTAQFRVDPNEEALVPFLAAFAKAIALMPSLKDAVLWSPLKFYEGLLDEYKNFDPIEVSKWPDAELAWGIVYTKPSMKAFTTSPGENYIDSRQIWWRVGRWRPDPELHQHFQKIGRDLFGEELLEYWPSEFDDAGEGLDYREDFKYYVEFLEL